MRTVIFSLVDCFTIGSDKTVKLDYLVSGVKSRDLKNGELINFTVSQLKKLL